jgi:hypothetical protein
MLWRSTLKGFRILGTEGLTPAVLAAIVEEAELAAFRESTTTGRPTPITTAGLLGALLARGGADRPTPGIHRWDDLVLDPRAKQELQQVERLIEDPELARSFEIDPPSGLLLAGPPGTGKTTIARVLAAEDRGSFYSVSAADLTSKWGESERRVQTLFDRTRDNAPSIVFLDELDAIAGRRGAGQDFADRLLTQLLTEIDRLGSRPGVFVVGATNRLDVLDRRSAGAAGCPAPSSSPCPTWTPGWRSRSCRADGCPWARSTWPQWPASPRASPAATSRRSASRRPSTRLCAPAAAGRTARRR